MGKASELSQARGQHLEGKVGKGAGNDHWNVRTCFKCHEKGHIASQCGKNREDREFLPQKVNLNKPKAIYCVQQRQVNTTGEESVSMATQTEFSTPDDNMESHIPFAEITHCYLIKTNQEELVHTAGDNICVLDNKYMALKDSCSQVTLCHPDIVPQKYILPRRMHGSEGNRTRNCYFACG